jgi:cyclopropane fatty-acyl-phospholipid synthase-like methyltransferase
LSSTNPEEESVSQSTNAWDKIFAREGRVFLEPHEDMPKIVQMLKDRGASTVLDLGSGTGRHVVYLARNGFSAFGLDNSPEGIEATRRWLVDEGLEADLRLQSMTEKFPYEDSFFDAVVSVQVIHHADMATIRGIVDEVSRVLKTGGFLFVTVPKLRNQGRRFEQLEPNTFVPLDGPEKGLPHHYFTRHELREVLGGYDIADVHLDVWQHYCLSAFKR